ncbi:heme/copper-type cytochrome/quinol oxidase subunit 4 [Melghirimyces profundicolus]|uniref:Heme/copper-type cytochrome/quinol oxidase subunit 4 n=1 Tax=Melghirimyces profundicolus TaxID=1242148 RepID=A0A2T6C7B5_9BACL|nr:cytochrome C oxidase subunit IV family protein [Melghirimyces profundicolus]PTX64221.1 heme/copper-type cytochrome/quinol oxidase subunit 4 [Melghirimyces profundicolus]
MTRTDHNENTRPRETTSLHLKSFGWMLLFTAIAFALVGGGYFPAPVTFTVLLFLAFVQLILQLTTFMHLDRRSQLPILFIVSGVGFSVIIAVALWIMKG